jgi:hypothetical protein
VKPFNALELAAGVKPIASTAAPLRNSLALRIVSHISQPVFAGVGD